MDEERVRNRARSLLRRVVIFFVSLTGILIVWYFYAIHTNRIIIATPQRVLSSLIDLFVKHDLAGALLGMLWLLFLGLGLSILVGIPVGLVMGRLRIVEDVLDPYMTAFSVVPRIAMVPL